MKNLQKIDSLTLKSLPFLDETDECYFIGNYTGGESFTHSPMNNLINNLKKPMDRINKPEWNYKTQAINSVSGILLGISGWNQLSEYTWVPIPPSKVKNDPFYDNRLMQILEQLKKADASIDVRELLVARHNRVSAHCSTKKQRSRPTYQDLLDNIMIDSTIDHNGINKIIIFDDLLTTGKTFKSAKERLKNTFPDATIIGLFIARNVRIDDQQSVPNTR